MNEARSGSASDQQINDDAARQRQQQQQQRRWHAVKVAVCDQAAIEAVEYALMEAGAGGTETLSGNSEAPHGSSHIVGYFDFSPNPKDIRAQLDEAVTIYNLPLSSIASVTVSEVVERDWLAEWKRSWRPVVAGRFVVAPPWTLPREFEISKAAVPNQIVIRIEPGMAFGTGTHETTQLCLHLIEKYFNGNSFLDVGTGTGILSIAAAKLRPDARIEACDTDAAAVAIAIENARLNEVAERIQFRVGTVQDNTTSADCVCANLTADVILPLLSVLLGATCNRLILSGILDSQADTVRNCLQTLGINNCETITHGEWTAIIV